MVSTDVPTEIELRDILPVAIFERVRDRWGPMVWRVKAARRVEFSHLSVLFESRTTALWQIHEVLRVESRTSTGDIQREIDEYARLVPGPGVLTATLSIHAGSAAVGEVFSRELDTGLICLEVGAHRCPCRRLDPDDREPAAIHYIAFDVTESAQAALHAGEPGWLRVESSVGCERLPLGPETRASLLETLDLGRPPRPSADEPSSDTFIPILNADQTWPSW
ncbi:hypothetical protein PPSIR1_16695 [Plesiocystis pacifica SIR-1]|uniref:Uncharacterized protein n=1 Tax=Plesiocystis pacifica SIR-1 TaxID=391625 RepID=A6G394_9BACT|nr:hypothetical protein PPSIR1_16695 [Plesiocystis pacifica SIR-1]